MEALVVEMPALGPGSFADGPGDIEVQRDEDTEAGYTGADDANDPSCSSE